MAALRQAARRLCYHLGTKTGLFEPTAAQEKAMLQAALKRFKFDAKYVDDVARDVFWGLRKDGVQHITLADVTHTVQALSNVQTKLG
ncbi:hypothetical protein VPH35_017400 [Triticum aestivum]